MSAVKRLILLDEGQLLARIDKHNLPDLDDVLLEMADGAIDEGMYWMEDVHELDEPTRLTSADVRYAEASVRHRRISPCFCGDHGWHLDSVHEDEDGMPDRKSGRGAFLAVMFE